ncbi:nucleoside diphosphate kinase regulator [Caenispirillum bisanense]|uniref:nucleoside diphosphate kinase regulator n=1 Tax=Caenispirillum bisanense TaxID=414052 RepID=UPI0031D4896B
MTADTTVARPPVFVTPEDFNRLYTLAEDAARRVPAVADYLLDELERATQVPAAQLPPDAVTMGSRVRYRDDATGRERTVTLVFPGEENADAAAVSILTPVGAALFGMRAGAAIDWQTPGGERRTLTVLEVEPPRRDG